MEVRKTISHSQESMQGIWGQGGRYGRCRTREDGRGEDWGKRNQDAEQETKRRCELSNVLTLKP